MGISLRDLADDETFTMREVALDRGFEYLPFSLRELVTPQVGFGEPDTRPGEQEGLPSAGPVRWANWIDDYVEDPATRLEPRSKTELRKAMVNMLDVDGTDAEVRSVGSGHSHSNAAEPPMSFVDLRRLRGTLSHNDWLAVEEEISRGLERDYIRDPEGAYGEGIPESNLVRVKAGTILKQLNRLLLPNLGDNDENPPGKALKNMGSWDGQTLAGAINTGTHGTGIDLGSLADVVQSVEIATVPEARSGVPIVQLYRIEPGGGITDREVFEAETGDHEMELIQDDDVFYSAVVGYGCMGNVFAYTLHVRDAYWLAEDSQLRQWEAEPRRIHDRQPADEGLKEKIDTDSTHNPSDYITRDPDDPIHIDETRDTRHFGFLLNLAAVQYDQVADTKHDNPICLVTRHKEIEAREKPDDWDDSWPPERKTSPVAYFFKDKVVPYPLGYNPTATMSGVTDLGNFLKNNFFDATASEKGRNPTLGDPGPFEGSTHDTASYIALRRLPDRGSLGNPDPPKVDTITTEVAVPIDQLSDAIDAVIQTVRDVQIVIQGELWDHEEYWHVFFPAPMGVRYVAGSHHHLSPEFDADGGEQPRAMIEVPIPAVAHVTDDFPPLTKGDTRDRVAKPALEEIEDVLVEEYDGRPHMGKHFSLGRDDLASMYSRFEGEGGWLETYRRFNAFGTFNNEFTEKLGISVDHGEMPDPPEIPAPGD